MSNRPRALVLAAFLAAGCAERDSEPEHDRAAAGSDSAFVALQQRGAAVMGVNQYTSHHQFVDLPDGGRIELQRDTADAADIATIRAHLREIARSFQAGDFRMPGIVHDMEVPGTAVMATHRQAIAYTYADLPRGGAVRIATDDAEALAAIRQFLAFQRTDHRVH